MGKSLRSKSVLRAKSVKRKGEFQKAVDARTQRLFDKAQDELVKQKVKEQEEAKDEETKEAEEDTMAVDEPVKDDKKVSTSGYRTARHHLYKKNNKKKSNNMAFKKKK